MLFSLIELSFSSLHSPLSRAMKVAAFKFTSGLGQKTGPPTSAVAVAVLVVVVLVVMFDTSTSMCSLSGELLRELWLLRTLTKPPRTVNFIAVILNGGGGGGAGISGDWLPVFMASWTELLLSTLFGNGGLPEFLRRGGSGGGAGGIGIWLLRVDHLLDDVNGGSGGGGGGADTEWIFLFFPSPFLNKL